MNRFRLIAALLVLATGLLSASAASAGYWACEKGQWTAVDNPSHAKPLIACDPDAKRRPGDRTACTKASGTWRQAGLSPKPICVLPTIDARRTCGDRAECQGMCLAEPGADQIKQLRAGNIVPATGRCTPLTPVFGCIVQVVEGRLVPEMCID